MPRRSWNRAARGQVFAVEWPEWFVECAVCWERAFLVPTGEARTAREAEAKLRRSETQDDTRGWRKVQGLWRCGQHEQEG